MLKCFFRQFKVLDVKMVLLFNEGIMEYIEGLFLGE